MAAALDQLSEGVPLNWGQVEDDQELFTLARLQRAGAECRQLFPPQPEPQERALLADRLAARIRVLPTRRKERKEEPRTLAGFSERVPVLTQVDDKVTLTTNVPLLLARAAGAVALLIVAVWSLSALIGAFSTPRFTWIEVRKGDEILNRVERPNGWQEYPCRQKRQQEVLTYERFQPYPSLQEAAKWVALDVPLIPATVHTPMTHTLDLILSAVAPCDHDSPPVEGDPAAMLMLVYSVRHPAGAGTVVLNQAGRPSRSDIVTTLIVYVAQDQPLPIDATDAEWREVKVLTAGAGPPIKGLAWSGRYFQDRSGMNWAGPVNVLMVERGNKIMMLEGSIEEGMSHALMMEIVRNIVW